MKKFEKYSTNPENPNWEKATKRETPLYPRNNDIRNDFERDYTRIIHSNAYRRLKHKTQVFFSPENDHICTRIEHVTHVVYKLLNCQKLRSKYRTYKSNFCCS